MLVLALGALAGRWFELVTLFTLVLIHEWAHAVCARVLGWEVQSVVLLPFGGALYVTPPPLAPPWQEVAIALAGPLVHVPLIVLGWFWTASHLWQPEMGRFWFEGNAMLFLFNLLPLYPLDGGRIVLSLLTLILPYRFARVTVYGVTVFLSVLFALTILFLPAFGYALSGSLSALLVLPYVVAASIGAFRQLNYTMHRFFLERYMYLEAVRSYQVRRTQVKGHWTMGRALRTVYRCYYHVYDRASDRVYEGTVHNRLIRSKRRIFLPDEGCYPLEEANILALYFTAGSANMTFSEWEAEHCQSSR